MNKIIAILIIFLLTIGSGGLMAQEVSANLTAKEKTEFDAKSLTIPKAYLQNLHWDLPLDTVGKNGSKITWRSSNQLYLSDQGKFLKRAPVGKRVMVKIIATVAVGMERSIRSFEMKIANEEPIYDGYLFAYFEGSGAKNSQEQLHFGLSDDAVNWHALNKNLPIIASADISTTGGIRDPHILRGEDQKSFYLVATDMFTIKNGWDYNPGIVMLRSNDLINWTHGIIDLEKLYPTKFPNVKWVWAPQTIYDPAVDKYLVYFTVRLKDNPELNFYYAYANKDFTSFEDEPKLMFKPKFGAIDGDIIYENGLYHFFYKGNTKDEKGKELINGIQQATAKTLQGPWIEDFKYVDAYAQKHISVEGSGIFKVNNSNTYILMYDLYRDHRYEFQRSTDLFSFSQNPESFSKDFNPRHGTVISVTLDEMKRLNKRWNDGGSAKTDQKN